ncbi:MAG: bifunctional methylenetetrahydrofolate dehydrogenase/methenyltetrahydrofolate cyclohydrolase [Chlorobiaceae bacterium]|nr:bifunctional methylenetetrahydrofolate dehydrogenase/methenyltetrahydrofolate cyclohydrolase [Chlorobiaceae bacterium]NTV61683.1 bifunctional methylenetetrahydrofolate dehydrogenase/methenyltetrahydrofolate cyclohydrolase [Chlorobiaceae bacterium]
MNILKPDAAAAVFRDFVKNEIRNEGLKIKVAGVLASPDPASATYSDYTRSACEDVGIDYRVINIGPESVKEVIEEINCDRDIHGIFIYYPIWNDARDAEIRDLMSPKKDVEGLTSYWIRKLYANDRFDGEKNQFKAILPCTPLAIIKILEQTDAYMPYGLPFKGQTITVFNRSEVVGRPLAYMLSNDGARVYSFDINGCVVIDLSSEQKEGIVVTREDALKESDIVITGVPSKNFDRIRAGELKEGAICLNFSSVQNFTPEAQETAGLYIPRVGPMTVAICMRNALQLYRNYHQEKN